MATNYGLCIVIASLSANFCIEKGLPSGMETPCFRTWQWTHMTRMENMLIPKL